MLGSTEPRGACLANSSGTWCVKSSYLHRLLKAQGWGEECGVHTDADHRLCSVVLLLARFHR